MAIWEQLGGRLEVTKGLVHVLVIDHIEKNFRKSNAPRCL